MILYDKPQEFMSQVFFVDELHRPTHSPNASIWNRSAFIDAGGMTVSILY
jgi:hypothetical protein